MVKVSHLCGLNKPYGLLYGTKLHISTLNHMAYCMVLLNHMELQSLTNIAVTQPHAALAAFTHGLRHRWSFSMRTMRCLGDFLQPLESLIRHQFIPTLFGMNRDITDHERALFALPCREGGLALDNPLLTASRKWEDSTKFCSALKGLLIKQESKLDLDREAQQKIKAEIRKGNRDFFKEAADDLRSRLDDRAARVMDLAREKVANAVFSTLPLKRHGFAFAAKRDFRDLLCMRYDLPIPNLPQKCICGAA